MGRITLLIALLAAFPPLSTDMYLPAIPRLQAEWQQPLFVINLTLICFFITYCLFMLIYGPVSDRYGRRRPLLVGTAIYIVACLICAQADSVYTLIGARILQASGAASASALSLAMSKDLFEARMREQVLAYIAVIMALAPMSAPIIGGWVMHYLNWRWIFVVQALMGLVAWIGVYVIDEPLKHCQSISPAAVLLVYVRIFQNRRFVSLMLAMSILVLPLFAFIGGAPDIYMTQFGLDECQFGYLFGLNAIASMLGAFLFMRLSRRFSSRSILTGCFLGILFSGVLMLALPHHSPWGLTLPMWVLTFFLGISRPPSNNLILEQVDHGVGSASALIVFTFMTGGAMSMGLISLAWGDKIAVLGTMAVIVASLTLVFWLKFRFRFLPLSAN